MLLLKRLDVLKLGYSPHASSAKKPPLDYRPICANPSAIVRIACGGLEIKTTLLPSCGHTQACKNAFFYRCILCWRIIQRLLNSCSSLWLLT
jgi:hypothetical protein